MPHSGIIKHCFMVMLIIILTPGTSFSADTGNLEQLRQRALVLVNKERRERGVETPSEGNMLNTAAQTHAADMLKRSYYSHVSPEGNTVMDRYIEAGGDRWQLTAENIAQCRGCPIPPTVERVESLHQGRMNRPPHRENILWQGLDRFGFGIIAGSDQTLYAVQTFAGPGRPRNLQPDEQAHAIEAEQQTTVALQRVNKERQTNNREPLKAYPALIQAASNLVQGSGTDGSALNIRGNLSDALPDDASRNWQTLAGITGRCGGCGEQPTAADVRFFVQQQEQNPTCAPWMPIP
ncbi:CAP domain-containing protein [Microvirga pakistanensis]|uniref:CAP domain-containing protein n=1 Tax=Microvirga pakistanensis TaxID=1682650 RepID=UPI00106BB9FC|nr:CAP domain-containing protein [Microvirga pakistanensis]